MKHCKIDDAINCSNYPNCTYCIYFVDDEAPGTFENTAKELVQALKIAINSVNNYNKYLENYIKNDIDMTRTCYNNIKKLKEHSILPEIKDVKFNPPATIIFWADNTKTVVKTQEGDDFDPEIGMAMAISKKAYGNKGLYYNHIKKWTDKYYEENADKVSNISKIIANMIMNGLGKGDD